MLKAFDPCAIAIAEKGYDPNSIRPCIRALSAIPNIPNRSNRKKQCRCKKSIYRQRNLVERFFNKLKQFPRTTAPHDNLGATFSAFNQLASIRIYLRTIESKAW